DIESAHQPGRERERLAAICERQYRLVQRHLRLPHNEAGTVTSGCFATGKSHPGPLPLLKQPYTVRGIQVYDAHAVRQEVIGKQPLLGGEIVFEIGMKMEMVLGEIREQGTGKTYPAYPVLAQRMR